MTFLTKDLQINHNVLSDFFICLNTGISLFVWRANSIYYSQPQRIYYYDKYSGVYAAYSNKSNFSLINIDEFANSKKRFSNCFFDQITFSEISPDFKKCLYNTLNELSVINGISLMWQIINSE